MTLYLAFYMTYILTFDLAFFLAFYLTYILAWYLEYCHSIWHGIWHIFRDSTWHICWHSIRHIFWHSIWDSFSHSIWRSIWHSIWHIFWHSIWHSIWRLRSSSAHWAREVPGWGPATGLERFPVEVQQCTVISWDGCWGRAAPTGIGSWRELAVEVQQWPPHSNQELARRRGGEGRGEGAESYLKI